MKKLIALTLSISILFGLFGVITSSAFFTPKKPDKCICECPSPTFERITLSAILILCTLGALNSYRIRATMNQRFKNTLKNHSKQPTKDLLSAGVLLAESQPSPLTLPTNVKPTVSTPAITQTPGPMSPLARLSLIQDGSDIQIIDSISSSRSSTPTLDIHE